MMKKILISLVTILSVAFTSRAQSWDEWFSQKKTQKKYLLEQIAALQVYTKYAQKGYGIVKDGLHTIENIKHGDFGLHEGYFNSLKDVNPSVRKYPKVKEILNVQRQLINVVGQSRKQLQGTDAIAGGELDYINGVYDRLVDDSNNTVEELETVITPGKVTMKDDERIGRIDQLYGLTIQQFEFVKAFSAEVAALAYARLMAKKDIGDTRLMNGIK
jgi:hypothetical protein